MIYDIPPSASMTWPVVSVYDGTDKVALKNLANIFSKLDVRSGEDDTKSNAIEPILNIILQFPEGSYKRTTRQVYIGDRGLRADYSDSKDGVDFIIEAKSVKKNLLGSNILQGRWNSESRIMEPNRDKFLSPIDQGLEYLNQYNANACIITNGYVWYLFKRGQKIDNNGNYLGLMFFGVRFRLDRAVSDNNVSMISKFIEFFHFNSIVGENINKFERIDYCTPITVPRSQSWSYDEILMHDFSGGPLHGPGVGFGQWKDD